MNSTPRADSGRIRALPWVVAGLAAVAGLLFIAYLVTGPRPIGLGGPSASETPGASSEPTAGPSVAATAEPPATPSIEPTEAPTPTPSPTLPAGPVRLAWTVGAERDGMVHDVIRFADRWVAGGFVADGPALRATVWTSADGIAWSEPIGLDPAPVQEEGFWGRYWIRGLGEWNGELMAFGWHGVGCCDAGSPMLWRSIDGEHWQVVDTAGTGFTDQLHFPQSSVLAPDGRLVVLSASGLGGGTAVLLSPDLATWEMRSVGAGSPSALAASPARLIAAAVEQPPYDADDPRPATIPHAWTSTDGSTWSPIEPPSGAVSIGGIAWDGTHGRFVAVGNDTDGRPFAWLTADGTRWSTIPLGDDAIRMDRVVAADGLIVASGVSGGTLTPPEPPDTIVWSSHDGLNWWYETVLDGRAGTVEAAVPGAAIIVSPDDEGGTWLGLVGTPTPLD